MLATAVDVRHRGRGRGCQGSSGGDSQCDGERDRSIRQREPDEAADRHRQSVHQERRDADAGQHDPPPVRR